MAQVRVQLSPFKLNAGDAALDFVNTLDERFAPDGPKELLKSYQDLLQFTQQAQMLSIPKSRELSFVPQGDEVLQSAIELREVLARIFYSSVQQKTPSPRDLLQLSEYCREASKHRRLVFLNSTFTWQWVKVDQEPQMPVWMLAQQASDLLTSDRIALVRSCDAENCRWLFLDTSKNHTRRWCDMKTCGNRMKARRFQARQATIEESA